MLAVGLHILGFLARQPRPVSFQPCSIAGLHKEAEKDRNSLVRDIKIAFVGVSFSLYPICILLETHYLFEAL